MSATTVSEQKKSFFDVLFVSIDVDILPKVDRESILNRQRRLSGFV
jgi:hypothetical protein